MAQFITGDYRSREEGSITKILEMLDHQSLENRRSEAVQHRSARWATRDYQRTSSVTQMIKVLNWRTLEQRRIDSRLTLMYKITYHLVAMQQTT